MIVAQPAPDAPVDVATLAAHRVCPQCGTADALQLGASLWPAGWRCSSCGHALSRHEGFAQLAPDLDETDIGMSRDDFALLARVEDRHFWFVTRNELIGWLVSRFAGQARQAIEIGCGTGFVLNALKAALPEARIAGSELHSRALLTARKRHGHAVELFQMDARHSGLRNAIDLVGAFDVLEHIPEDEAVLREIGAMLRPGGRLIASVPQHPFMWSHADDLAHHQRRYRRGELANKARAAGLRPVYQTSFVVLAFPAMAAARLMARRHDKPTSEDHHDREFRISPATNAVLGMAARCEHGLRRFGVPMPFGGSQILVAERPD